MRKLDMIGSSSDVQGRIDMAAYDAHRSISTRVALTPFGACGVRVGGTESPHTGAIYPIAHVGIPGYHDVSNEADARALRDAATAGATHAWVHDLMSRRNRVVEISALT